MKPHLRREWSNLFKRYMWFCRGDGAMGYGDDVKVAYFDWKYALKKLISAKTLSAPHALTAHTHKRQSMLQPTMQDHAQLTRKADQPVQGTL